MADRTRHLTERHPRAVLAAWGAFALVAAALCTRARTAHDPRDFLPADSLAHQMFAESAARVGGSTFAALGYESQDVLGAQSLSAVGALSDDLATLPGVSSVQSLPSALGTRGVIPEPVRVELALRPDLSGNLLSTDRQAGAIWVTMSGPEVLRDIQRTVAAHPDANAVHMAGPAVFAQTFDSILTRDLLRVGLPLVSLLALAVLAIFRRWQAAAGTVAVIGLGLLGAVAPLAALGQPLTILNLAALPLIAVAGLATAIHWLWAWLRTAGNASRATAEIAAPCTWAALTTAAAMASLALMGFPALRWMGISAATGVLVTLPAALTLLPALMAFSPPPVPNAPRLGASLLPRVRPHSRRVVWGLFSAVAVIAALGLPRLSVESNIALAMPPSLPLRRAEAWFEPRLGGMVPLEIIATGTGAASSPMAEQTLAALRAEPDLSTLNRPSESDVFHATVRLPELPSSEMETRVAALESQMRAIWPPQFDTVITGEVPLILGAMGTMLRGMGLSLAAALLVIFALMAIELRSLRWAALGLIPNALPILAVLGLMGWAKRPVDLATTSVGCAALGVAVDDTIHVLHRHRWRTPAASDRWTLHGHIVSEVGPALLLTTLTAILCFASLSWATPVPLRWFGVWAALALGIALVADLHLLPTLLPKESRS